MDNTDNANGRGFCEEQGIIRMAVSTLARISEDEPTRQEYLKRQDEIILALKREKEYKEMKLRAEEEQRRAEQEQRRAELAEASNEKLRQELAELKAQMANSK